MRFGQSTPDDRCRDIAEKMMYVHGIARAAYAGWERLIESDYPVTESIIKINNVVTDLHKEGMIADPDFKVVEQNIREILNDVTREYSAKSKLLVGLLKDNLLDLSINSVCGCVQKYPNRVDLTLAATAVEDSMIEKIQKGLNL